MQLCYISSNLKTFPGSIKWGIEKIFIQFEFMCWQPAMQQLKIILFE